jgi:hypothetical protein
MRKRAPLPAIMLVTFFALTWLLVLPDEASADDPYTVAFINIPIEASGLHNDVTKIKTFVRLYKSEEALNADISIEDWQNWNKGYATCSSNYGAHRCSEDIYWGVHPTEFTKIPNLLSLAKDYDRLDSRGSATKHNNGSVQYAIQVSDYKEDGSQFSFEEMGFTHYRIYCSGVRYHSNSPNNKANMDFKPVEGAMPDAPHECSNNIEYGYECVDNTNCWMMDAGLYGPISDLVEE